MNNESYTYTVKCRTCSTPFKVQLFDSHEKNLFVVDKKDWYCDKCKSQYFAKQTNRLSKAHKDIGFAELTGSAKMISWAEKIRAELINKATYLKNSLAFENDAEKELTEKAFETFLSKWQNNAEAKWWIDNRNITVRDISNRIAKIIDEIRNS